MINGIGVYQIELDNKKYIGSTTQKFNKRWYHHLYELRKGNHPNRHLQNAYNKYGEETLKFSIIEVVETPEEVIIVEQKYLDELKPEYNILPMAGISSGRKLSDETKRKMSEISKGKPKSEEHKRNISKSKKGSKCSEITKLKMRESGKNRVDLKEWIQKMRELNTSNKYRLGYKATEERNRKFSEKMKGHIVTEETRHKIGLSNSIANKGNIVTEETKIKISKTLKEYWNNKKY